MLLKEQIRKQSHVIRYPALKAQVNRLQTTAIYHLDE
jgi:hypothetical protein